MPRVPRFDSFPIEPAAILADPAFQAMSPLAQRAYLILLLNLWGQKEPGIIPDSDFALAPAAWVGLEEWRELRPEVAPALDRKTRHGSWVSPKMVETHAAQVRWYATRKRAGKKGGKASAGKRISSTRQAQVGLSLEQSSTGGGRREEGREGGVPHSAPVPRLNGSAIAEAGGRWRAPLLAAFGSDLLEQLQAEYPERDGALIASKCLDSNPKKPKQALRNWFAKAREFDSERRPTRTEGGDPQEGDRNGDLVFLGGQWRGPSEAEQWGGGR
jgi:uncharacterized protein YdaU (DUF1376 family)